MKRIFPALVLASAIAVGATGCTGSFDDVFEDQIAIAEELNLSEVGDVTATNGIGGGTVPASLEYVVEGPEVRALLGERLTDSGFKSGHESGDRESWTRDLAGAHHRVTLLFVEEGTVIALDGRSDVDEITTMEPGVRVYIR
ncbi:hypothetical protein IFT90_15385 [Frigoribacterium sp. CFBP 8766]|uniref:hypothetical protein n=1 Tax=Frigoribacterium sp. CFBP 8766 TaxID=2775273 RepID=UPI00178626FF|nr:hypothetical protein [Frigoribacterium sp. CFBP 8766]MBD8585937.1 hypothetical protein [Frigoribacterium sp. CFBP 8766]